MLLSMRKVADKNLDPLTWLLTNHRLHRLSELSAGELARNSINTSAALAA